MTEWRVVLDGAGGTVEPELRDVEVTQNANPFGDSGTAFISDQSGNRADQYTEGRRVDFESREFGSGNNWDTQLAGYIVESRPRSEGAGDILEVECYSLDTLLRRNDMNGDLSGQTLTDALKDLIQNWADGVTWDASKVSPVQPDLQINRPYTNERVDNIIQLLRRRSGNEEFGVDSSLDFFFRPAETKTVSGGIGPGDWNSYDLPERAAESINEVRVFFDDGDRSVIVDESSRKTDLEESLGASEPVTTAESIMREQITTRREAIAAGKKVLEDRSPVLNGHIDTFGLLDADPGDTISVRIPQRGINDEFLIAQLEYSLPDTVTVTVVRAPEDDQKSTDPHSDMLVRLSDSLQRVEMRPAKGEDDLDEKVRVLETLAQANLEVSGDIDRTPLSEFAVTNTGYEAIRDAIVGTTTVTTGDIAVGTGDSQPARSQDSLDSESESLAVSPTTDTGPSLQWRQAAFSTADDIQEVGVKDGNGDVIVRGITDSAVTDPDSATVTVTITDGQASDETVLTTTGQTYVRDVLAANSPTHPDDFAIGDGSVTLSESDTTLANQLLSRDLGNEIIYNVDGKQGWQRITSFGITTTDTDVRRVESGDLTTHQTAFVHKAVPAGKTSSLPDYTGGEANTLNGSDTFGSRIEFDVRPRYEYFDPQLAIRGIDESSSSDDQLEIYINDEKSTTVSLGALGWHSVDLPLADIERGGTNHIQIRGDYTTNVEQTTVDVVAYYDADKYDDVSTWDDSPDGDYLADPTLYADEVDVSLTIPVETATDNLTISSTWTATDNDQAIIIEGDVSSNTDTATSTFTSTDSVSATLRLSNTGTQTGATPTEGVQPQKVEDIEVKTGTGGIRKIGLREIEFSTIVGTGSSAQGKTLTELGVRDTNGDTLTHSTLPNILVEQNLSLAFLETWQFRRTPLDINQAFFDPQILNLSSVDDGDTSGTDYFEVSVVSTSTSL